MATTSESINLGNYELLTEFKLDYAPVTITKYRSKKTGFSVVVGDHKSPISNAYFVVATEIFDDSGRPHTLEHLIFLGSDKFPYKGVLDNLANRAGGDGTNAWTADDNTTYTISTAGSEGLLNMLPIYLDHVLHPTITDSGFVTEVYHINGKGEEAGVVMSEMQGVEQQSSTVINREMQLAIYPESSGYRSETGGLQGALRKLSVEQIRDYHKAMYRPDNICLTIDGSIPRQKLLDILNNQIDPLILSHNPEERPHRPFLESPSNVGPLVKNEIKTVEFMDKDESVGEVAIGYRGVKTGNHLEEQALDLLTTYLTDSEVAPLNKRFIEIPEPWCTSIAFYSTDRASASELTCSVTGVPYEKLDKMAGELKEALKDMGALDMDRMKTIIERDRRKLLAMAENNVTDVLTDSIIADFLYGESNGKELAEGFQDLKLYDQLLTWTAGQWSDLLDKYLIENPSVVVVGKPSAVLAEKIADENKERLQKRKADLGEEGLKAKAEIMEKAQAENSTPIPEKMITEFPMFDASTIDWIPVESAVNSVDAKASSKAVQKHIDADGEKLPYFIHFSHVHSNFVTIRAVFDTTKLPSELLPYVRLYEASLFALPIDRDGGIGYEEVVQRLTELTVSYEAGLGIRGDFPDVIQVSLKVEKHLYSEAISWLHDLLWKSVFDIERLGVVAAKLSQDLPRQKRNGFRVATSTAESLMFDQTKSASTAITLANMLHSMPEIVHEIKENPKEVVKKLTSLRDHVLASQGMRLSVIGDILDLDAPRSTWGKYIQAKPCELLPVPKTRDTMLPLGLEPKKKAVVVPVASVEGSFLMAYGSGPCGWDAKNLAACKLAAGVVNALESYFWTEIRGSGLAYGANIDVEEEHGLVSFTAYRSPDAAKAFAAGGKILKDISDGTIELDKNLVDAAKSSLSYAYAKQEGNPGAAALTAFKNEVFKHVPADQGARMLASFNVSAGFILIIYYNQLHLLWHRVLDR